MASTCVPNGVMGPYLTTVCLLASVTSRAAELTTVRSVATTRADKNKFNVANNSLHFVNVIKDNLRRNNDDYAAEEPRVVIPPLASETRRRFNDSLSTAPTTTASVPFIAMTAPPTEPSQETTVFRSFTLDLSKANKHALRKLSRGAKAKHGGRREKSTHKTTTIAPEERKARVARWKQIIEKSKRLHEYTSTPKIEPSSPVDVAMRPAMSSTPSQRTKTLSTKRRSRPPGARAARLPIHAFLPLRSPGPVRAPPNAEQLDMAPARGAYIHDLRLKGRFCHRHVLWPEGPKYDSKGNTILPAFNRYIYKKQFFETTKPPYVLPRCCNCCRKSVLGCQ